MKILRLKYLKPFGQAVIITAVSAILAIAVNFIRDDGIELVTKVPYDIFSPCRDSEATAEKVCESEAAQSSDNLYVDARALKYFKVEHVKGAVNIPYSALFGASSENIDELKQRLLKNTSLKVVVYGVYKDEQVPDAGVVDLAGSLARQLVEEGIKAKHFSGGIVKLKKNGIKTVKSQKNEL